MRKVNVPVMGHLLFLFMTIECSRSVHSIVLRMAQVNSNFFYKCYKYKKGGLFCQEVCGESFSTQRSTAAFCCQRLRTALPSKVHCAAALAFSWQKNQIFFQ